MAELELQFRDFLVRWGGASDAELPLSTAIHRPVRSGALQLEVLPRAFRQGRRLP